MSVPVRGLALAEPSGALPAIALAVRGLARHSLGGGGRFIIEYERQGWNVAGTQFEDRPCHSLRSASSGSIREARRAGVKQASKAATHIVARQSK